MTLSYFTLYSLTIFHAYQSQSSLYIVISFALLICDTGGIGIVVEIDYYFALEVFHWGRQ